LCTGIAVTLSATPVYGGTSPVYLWMKNTRFLGTGATLSYIPANGDVVYCNMVSNYFCRSRDTVASNNLLLSVDTPTVPVVTLTESPGYVIGSSGRTITFNAVVTNGGYSPSYQWLINGVPIIGATSATFTHTGFNAPQEDSVSCDVTSSGICPMTVHGWVYVLVSNVGVSAAPGKEELVVLPNPNKGEFVIRGSVGSANTEKVSVEITDIIGRQVYRNELTAKNGALNVRITLANDLANGMYIVNLRSGGLNKIVHMVIER
jgi:hypothetical protein